jgi:hypothetical protein
VQGAGYRVYGLGFRFKIQGLRVPGICFGFECLGYRV